MKSVYSPNDFLNLSSDYEMIQAAVDEAAKYGATVEIPRFNERTQKHLWEIDKTILLHTGSNVVLNNCHIRLCDYSYSGFFTNSNTVDGDSVYLKENRQYDITITGVGNPVLDGGKPLDVKEIDYVLYNWDTGEFLGRNVIDGREDMSHSIGIKFINVERVKVSNIHFVHQRYWGLCFWFCSFGVVRDIQLEGMNQVPNQDGVNLRVGTNNFLVENIWGYTGDDPVAINGMDGKRKDKSDMCPDIHHIVVRNIRIHLTWDAGFVRMNARNGVKLHDILVDGVMDLSDPGDAAHGSSCIRIGDMTSWGNSKFNVMGEMKNVVVRNVITRAQFGILVSETLCNAVFDSIFIKGGCTMGVYFNRANLKNVTVNNLHYDEAFEAMDSEIGWSEPFHKIPEIKELSAVHFEECTAENVVFNGVSSGRNFANVFGGTGSVEITAKDVATNDKKTKLANEAVKVTLK